MGATLFTTDSYKKTIMANSRDIMLDICKPLIENFDVTYVNYIKLFNDHTQITITTRPDWVEHFFKQKYYRQVVCETLTEKKGAHITLPWHLYDENAEIRHDEREIFNIDNGITLVTMQDGFKEYFHFATTTDSRSITDLYLYNFDVLSQFTEYFKDQAGALIKKAEKERILRA